MRENVAEIVRQAARLLPVSEPVVEVRACGTVGPEAHAGGALVRNASVYDLRAGADGDGTEDRNRRLTLPDHSVGTLIGYDILEHVPDPFRLLDDIDRVLAPGGLLLLTSIMYFPVHDQANDYWRITPEGLRRLLQRIGEPLILTQGHAEFPHTVIGVVQKGQTLAPGSASGFAQAVAAMPPNPHAYAWQPPLRRPGSWRERLLPSARKRRRATAEVVAAARPTATLSGSTPSAPVSAFDVTLSRRYYETEVWRQASWLGFPILQIPTDLMVLQELLFQVRPRVVVECGTHRGGATIFFASLLRLVHGEDARVISVDIVAHEGLREQLDRTPYGNSIVLLNGSSTSPAVFQQMRALIGTQEPVLVFLDSNHSYAHVREELNLYHPLVSPGSYLVVFDTICRFLADVRHGNPAWAHDNPLRAVEEFLPSHPEFTSERQWEKYMATFAPHGFLRRATPLGAPAKQ